MELAQFKLSSLSNRREAISSWDRNIRRSRSFFWLPAFFATLIVLVSPQVGFPQVLQKGAPQHLQRVQPPKNFQKAMFLQPPVRIQNPRFLVAPANLRRVRAFINYRLEIAELPAVNRRIETQLFAQKHWVDHHCQLTPEQHHRFDDLIRTTLEIKVERWNQRFLLPTARDLLPVTFVVDGLGQKEFDAPPWHKEIDSLLTKAQQAVLIDARREREAWLYSAVRDHAYAELDKFLYFSPQQRPLVEQHLGEMLSEARAKCFSVSSISKEFFLYGDTIELLTDFPHEQISPSQAAMLKSKRSNRLPSSGWNLLLTQSESPAAFNKKIDQLAEKLRQELMSQVMLRFDGLIAYQDLSPAAARRLEVAAEGAVHYKVNESKNSALQHYRIVQTRINNAQIGFAVRYLITFPRPDIEAVLSHPIFQEIEISLAEEFESYFKVIAQNEHKARVAYAVSLLDRELWLTQTQREAFHEMIAKRMAVKPITSPDDMFEIVLIAFPLATVSDKEIGEILNQSQLSAWKELKTHFEFSDDPSTDASASLKLPRANSKIAFKVPASITTPATIQPVKAIRESDPSVP